MIIVQARMNSTRLRGKILMDLAGHPMLAQQLRRLKHCRMVDEIVVATTTNDIDDPVITVADTEGVRWFRGSEHDVLSRYVGAASESNAEIIVRITADCPLIDPEVTDRVIQELQSNQIKCDYAANIIQRTFPQGLDTEALFRDTLERTHRLAQSAAAREHVTYFIYKQRPDLFLLRSITDTTDNSDLRWTVDTIKDLAMVRRLYDELKLGNLILSYPELLAYIRANPEVAAINSDF